MKQIIKPISTMVAMVAMLSFWFLFKRSGSNVILSGEIKSTRC